MSSIALITIYFLLLLLHGCGTTYVMLVSFSPLYKIENFAHLTQFRISIIFGIIFIWTDVLTIYILLSGNKFVSDAEYMEAFTVFLYMVPFAHFAIFRIISIFRGVAIQFYKEFVVLLFTRIFVASIVFFVGIALCSLSGDHYVPVFTAAYFAVFGLLNTIIFTAIKRKMTQAKLIVDDSVKNENVVVPFNEDGTPAIITMSTKLSLNSTGGVPLPGNAIVQKTRRAKQDDALKEITMTVKVAGMNALISAISTGIIFGIFNDGSFLSGAVVNIPFKVMAAFAMIAIAKIETGKRNLKVTTVNQVTQ